MKSFRKERAAEVVRGFLGAELLQLLDDRLKNVTITEVEMTPDLKLAKVFWTTFVPQAAGTDGMPPALNEKDRPVIEARAALQDARGELRRRIGAELGFRHTPDLHFEFDGSAARGARIDYLLQKASTASS